MLQSAPAQSVLREYWLGLSGYQLADLTNHSRFPDQPSGSVYVSLFETPVDWADEYGTRVRGFVVPPVTGQYTFWISSDDQSQLFLGTDENPATQRLIARVGTWTASRVWEEPRDGNDQLQKSAPILLEAGQRYYVEALQKEGAGGDNLAVGWQLPDGTLERPIPGARLAPWMVSTNAPEITVQPAAQEVSEGHRAVFRVSVIGRYPMSFQWQRNGQNLPTGTNQTLVLPVVPQSDHGATFRCVIANARGTAISQAATLTVVADPHPPLMARIMPTPGARLAQVGVIEVLFNENVTHVDAADLLLNGQAATNVTGLDAGPYVFQFWPALEAGLVQVTWAASHGIQDLALTPNKFAGTNWAYTIDPTLPTQLLRREVWTDIAGVTIGDLLSHPNYPGNPNAVSFEPLFEAPAHWGDNYGTRLRGFVHPPATGEYTFWIATDDQGELYLSTDETAANKRLIATVPSWVGSRVWNEPRDNIYLVQQSLPIRLEGGRRYYVEALQKEGGGGDNLAVGWQLPDGTLERPIPGPRLSHWMNSTNPPVLLRQPADLAVTELESAEFTVSANGGEPLTFQWWRDGGVLLGERTPTLRLENLTTNDHGSEFWCVVTNFFGSVTSRVAVLSVLPETIPPTVAQLNPPAGATVRQFTQVEVWFSESVTGVDAEDLLLEGQPATNVVGFRGGPYLFQFPPANVGTAHLEWSTNHGIADEAAVPNAFAGGAWSVTVAPGSTPGDLVINEFLAANRTGLTDEDGESQDWIELHNRGPQAVDLAGWALTDDDDETGQWVFPSWTLGPGAYLVVFASGKDRTPAGTGWLHTSFKLSVNCEYVGLLSPESPRVAVSELRPRYPEQRNDHSYGRDADSQWRYFSTPTPGAANGVSTIVGVVEPVEFSVPRGFFDTPFTVHLSSATPGATIRYTTNGSEPTAQSGLVYSSPLRITTTTLLRAAAFKTNHLPSRVSTHSYFLGLSSELRSLPVLSVVTDSNHIYGPSGIVGIGGGTFANGAWEAVAPGDYHNPSQRGLAWERPISLELIHPHDNRGFQVDCGLRVGGGNYIRPRYQPTSKFTYRAYFRGDYGAGRLEYPFFTNAPITSFNQLHLRAGMNDPTNPFIKDELVRRLYADLGQVSAHGAIMLLFINGQYKGYYNPAERIEEEFCQSWHGGGPDWDVITVGSQPLDGDTVEWTRLRNYVSSQDVTQPDAYLEIERRLDLVNFADYLLVNVYAGTGDWGGNNWRAARERAPGARFHYYVWDAEWAWGTYDRPVSLNSFENELAGSSEIATLYKRLKQSTEFRLLFADRVHRHLFNGGALMETNVLARFENLRSQLAAVLPNLQRDIATTWVPNRRGYLMQHLDGQGLLASDNAPVFSQHGGRVPAGFDLTLSAPRGTIYYTTNGADPRVRFSGSVAGDAAAIASGTVLTLTRSALLKARTLDGANWSALTEAGFTVGALGLPLHVTEIMYHPLGSDACEFIELFNAGFTALDLSGFSLEGVSFVFPQGSQLGAGQTAVLVPDADPALFTARYPGVPVFGQYANNLANNGERLAVLDRQGNIVVSVDYRDDHGWPTAADGLGYSLTVFELNGDPDNPANWTASSAIGGTPGNFTPATVQPPVIRLNELMAHNATAVPNGTDFPDWIELHNAAMEPLDLANWSLSDDSDRRKFVFPPETLVAGGGFLVVWCDDQTNAPGLHPGFGLSRDGETVFLFDAHTNRVDAVGFGLQLPDYSLARTDSPASNWNLAVPTPGAANQAASLASPTNLVINEWQANPLAGGSDWVELYNADPLRPGALQGLHLGNGLVTDQLRALSFIPAGGHALLFCDEQPGVDHLDLKLPADGSDIVLYDETGTVINKVYNPRQTEGLARGRSPDGASRLINLYGGATPGSPNHASDYAGPLLNELMARNAIAVTNAAGWIADWIEFYNPLSVDFDLSGLSLSVGAPQPGQWMFPNGTVISGLSFLVVWCDPEQPPSLTLEPVLNLGRGLAGESGGVFLFNRKRQLVDAVEYGFQIVNASLGRSGSTWRLAAAPTPGAPNAAAAPLGLAIHLRVNEWMADPADGNDWFELYNGDSLPVSLSGQYLSDDPSLAGAKKFLITPNSFIAGHGWVRFVADGDAFQGRDHVNFRLDNAGETLRLYQTGGTVIDSLDFGRQSPGVSEGRLADGSANIVAFPTTPTPGAMNLADTDLDGLPDLWESAHGLNPFWASDALADRDGDGLSNHDEFLAGTDPADPRSCLVVRLHWAAPDTVSLRFSTMPGQRYRVLGCDQQMSGPWFVLRQVPAAAYSRDIEFGDRVPAGNGQRFYRLEVEAGPP